jgi:hypothetical protein
MTLLSHIFRDVEFSIAYICTEPTAVLIALRDIVPNHARHDHHWWAQPRVSHILDAIREGVALPPIIINRGGPPWSVRDGCARVSVSRRAGLSHVPAVIVSAPVE